METSKMTSVGAIDKNNMPIVQTILQQIKYPHIVVFFTWGAKGFTACQSIDENKQPCLRFKVNVNILATFKKYGVEFVSTHGNLKRVVDEVYFDTLQSVIDEYVEKIDEYVY